MTKEYFLYFARYLTIFALSNLWNKKINTVEIEKFETVSENFRKIYAAILVEKPNHKGIVIGKNGESLKRIATSARKDMEKLFGGKIYLELWVKVKSGWADDQNLLKSLGYD